jgi:hypothetical protein
MASRDQPVHAQKTRARTACSQDLQNAMKLRFAQFHSLGDDF